MRGVVQLEIQAAVEKESLAEIKRTVDQFFAGKQAAAPAPLM
jgi:hypothetical protein